MANGYEINDMAKEESWRLFRILGELVEGFDKLSKIGPAVTIYGSARLQADDGLYAQTEDIAYRLGELGFSVITGGGPGVMEAANKGAQKAGVTSAYKRMTDKAASGLGGSGGGLLGKQAPDLDDYVTRKTLDGLFLKIAEQEKLIRENPVARTTDLLQKVFGAVGK